MRHLSATYAGEDFLAVQQEIEIGYELPAMGEDASVQTVYVTNYLWYIIGAAVIVVGCAIMAVRIGKKERKDQK